MRFSYEDYEERCANGSFHEPEGFRTFEHTDCLKYTALESEHAKRGHTFKKAIEEVQKRVDKKQFRQVQPAQTKALSYSELAFPAYRFIAPEVIADDWLAIAGWHKFGRDHALHQPLTAYIILKLLRGAGGKPFMVGKTSLLDHTINQILNSPKTSYIRDFIRQRSIDPNDIFVSAFGKRIPAAGRGVPLWVHMWRAFVVETLYLAALFHDMGYPWQYVNMLESHLDHAGLDVTEGNVTAEGLCQRFGSRFVMLPFWGYQQPDGFAPSTWPGELQALLGKALRETHGLPGALGFLYLNDRIEKFPIEGVHPVRRLCSELAGLAILMHDMVGVYWGDKNAGPSPAHPQLRVRFDVDPLSCILALADVLQDFGRPTADFVPSQKSVRISYDPPCIWSSLKFSPANKSLRIRYRMKDGHAAHVRREFAKKEEHQYFDPVHGYVALGELGVTTVCIDVRH